MHSLMLQALQRVQGTWRQPRDPTLPSPPACSFLPQEAKLAKKTGFSNAETLKKTANKFASFFKPAPGSAAKPTGGVPAGGSSAAAATPSRLGGGAASQAQSQGGASQQQQQQSQQGATGKRERGYAELFLKPEGAHLRR